MTLRLPTEHHLELLGLKGGCTGSSESLLVKMPHCWKSHVAAQIFFTEFQGGASFVDHFFMFRVCHAFLSDQCSLVVTCWERANLLALLCVMLYCVFVSFPCGFLGQVWYLIVSIPDLYLLTYFNQYSFVFALILYVPSTIVQLYRDGSSWVEPVLS